jgi:rod shape-determining protein MreC
MAPPSNRRPGYSRRAQYGVFLGYVTAVGGIVVALLVLGAGIAGSFSFAALRGVSLDITAPISSAGRTIVNAVGSSADSVANYVNAGAQNAALKAELRTSRQRLVEARAIALENRRLKRLLKLNDTTGDAVVTTRIIGSSFTSGRRLATLFAGSAAGVRTGQPVRAPEGLIGRIVESGRFASRALLITDAANFVPVRTVRDGTPGISAGHGDGTLDIKSLSAGANPFRRGDILVTSGTGGLYPPNIAVGVVVRVDGEGTIARPLADPGRVDFAIVQKAYEPPAETPLPVSPDPAAAAANAASGQ